MSLFENINRRPGANLNIFDLWCKSIWIFFCLGISTPLIHVNLGENKILDYFSISFHVLVWLDYFPHISLICFSDAQRTKTGGSPQKVPGKKIFGKMWIFVNKQSSSLREELLWWTFQTRVRCEYLFMFEEFPCCRVKKYIELE